MSYFQTFQSGFDRDGFFFVDPNAGNPNPTEDRPVRDWVEDYFEQARTSDGLRLSTALTRLSDIHLVPRNENEVSRPLRFDEDNGGFVPIAGGGTSGAELPGWMLAETVLDATGNDVIQWR